MPFKTHYNDYCSEQRFGLNVKTIVIFRIGYFPIFLKLKALYFKRTMPKNILLSSNF